MDDLADLRARALAAREFTHTVGECTFVLRVPTRTEMRQVAHQHGLLQGGEDAMSLLLLQGHLLRRAVVGWTGVRKRHLAPGAGDDPLPWSAAAVDLWVDANPDEADSLGGVLARRIQQRDERIEADTGN